MLVITRLMLNEPIVNDMQSPPISCKVLCITKVYSTSNSYTHNHEPLFIFQDWVEMNISVQQHILQKNCLPLLKAKHATADLTDEIAARGIAAELHIDFMIVCLDQLGIISSYVKTKQDEASQAEKELNEWVEAQQARLARDNQSRTEQLGSQVRSELFSPLPKLNKNAIILARKCCRLLNL